MKMRKFENRVRKDIFRFSIITIFIMLILTLVLFSLYSLSVRKIRLNQTAEAYSNNIEETIINFENDFYKQNEDMFFDFLAEESERSSVFSVFYAFNSHQELKSDFLILNNGEDILLSTNSIIDEDNAFLHYASIVASQIEAEGESATRIYHALNGEQYLLLFYPFFEGDIFLGYGVSLINGKEVSALQINPSVSYVIYDQYNNIFSTNTGQLFQTTRGKIEHNLIEESNTLIQDEYDIVRQPIGDNLIVMTYQQIDNYLIVLIRSIIGFIIITIIVIIQSFYFSHRVSKRTGNSLQIINEEMEKVKNDSNYLLKIHTDDEFEILADQINKMLNQLNEKNNENIILNQLNLEIEKRKLNAQFNPHFFANTLETIRSVMYIDPNIASKLILKMDKILRYSIDETVIELTLEEDIEYIIDYLEINNIRLEEFRYMVEIDPHLKEYKVPKLFLLPLIENSLKYGYKNRRDLLVKITIKQNKNNIQIRVIDNGGQLTKKAIQQINEYLYETEDFTVHHGLKNTKLRMELLYPNSKFKIFTKLGFTIVEITIMGE